MAEVLSISQIVKSIKNSLEGDYSNIIIEGEISNFSYASSGHYYFNLKDNNAMISCAMFRSMAMRSPIIRQMRDGVQIQAYGDISVYEKRGSFQILVKKIVPLGQGSLKERFERLKRKLASKGLFDLTRKKEIPPFTRKIGVVTALGAAALQDFLNIFSRRSLYYEIVISPALVQGEAAPRSIMKAMKKLETISDLDVVVVTRGGGSLEDLWAFNNEELVEFMSEYSLPIISAVGHQVDFTLSDYVADKRLETPSAAAEFLTQYQTVLQDKKRVLSKQLEASMKSKLNSYDYQVDKLKPIELIRVIEGKIHRSQKLLERFASYQSSKITRSLERYLYKLEELLAEMTNVQETSLFKGKAKLGQIEQFLEAVNPKRVLKRGYSYTELDGNVINSAAQFAKLAHDSKMKIVFHDGSGEIKKV